MLTVLRQRNFALFWFGQLISLIGDMLLFVALPFYVFSLTNSTLATGIMFIVETLPRLVLSSLAGVFVDRWNRKYTLVIANSIQVFVLLPLLLVQTPQDIWLVYIFSFMSSCASQFTVAASAALGPNLVPSEQLLAANSLSSISMELTRLIGPLLAGVLMGLLGKDAVVLADACSFLCVAGMIALVRMPVTVARTVSAEEEPRRVRERVGQFWREWTEGLKLARRQAIITAIFLALGTSMIAEGVLQVMLAPWVKSSLHGDTLTIGYLAAAQAVGGLLGSALLPRISKRLKPALLIPLCGVCLGLLVLAIVNIPLFWLDLLIIALIGFTVVGFFINLFTLLQHNTADAYRGRIFGAFGMLQAVTMLIGMGLASSLGDKIGIVAVIDVAAACYFGAGLLAFRVVHALAQQTAAEEIIAEPATDELLGEKQVAV